VTTVAARGAALAASCLLLSACPEPPYETARARSLEEVSALAVHVRTESSATRASIAVVITGHFDEDGNLGLIWLADLAVQVGGYRSERGRDSVNQGSPDDDLPHTPSVDMELPDEVRVDGAVAMVTDGVTTLEIPLGDGLVPRNVAWIEPVDGVLHGDDHVSIRWSPASDLSRPLSDAFVSDGSSFLDIEVQGADPEPGVLRASMPPLTTAGEVGVVFRWDKPPSSTTCLTGTCTTRVGGVARLPAIVEPVAP
jgi:hypothetical protein